MGYVIAIATIIIYCLSKNKANIVRKDMEEIRRKEIEKSEIFKAKYTDVRLENSIRALIQNRDKEARDKVNEEIYAAFDQMEHWNGYRPYISLEDEVDMAVDIMLANRGKISLTAERRGYKSYLSPTETAKRIDYTTRDKASIASLRKDIAMEIRQYERKIKQREFVSWIRDTLMEQGVVVVPLSKTTGGIWDNTYVWEGSYATVCVSENNLDSLYATRIENPVPVIPTPIDIPDPYYKKK